jgi:hydrogenase maturation factor
LSGVHDACDSGQGCITCGDQASELGVIAVDAARGLAVCADDTGAESEVETLLVEPVSPGERLLVHAGTAIARAERAEARPSPEPLDTPGRRAG